ncbi:hypothetical protein BIW11_09158 [Tropilaelaps mercedesae]|uniref:Uncharacterized protein n=1 Tax=Tropilaelaps mercedesae TaxID=418985 RepID=A0A1V9XLB3_9ACAR|nr:hypothetical protein BIW11_09158 [Tropilaelaps mercedesae]
MRDIHSASKSFHTVVFATPLSKNMTNSAQSPNGCRGRRRISTVLLVMTMELCVSEDIVPIRIGNGPTPPSAGRRRKDPTADLPDLSREELLAILDLIEKSGDASTPSPVGTPTKKPGGVTTPTRNTTPAPSIRPRIPSGPVDLPDVSPPEMPPRHPVPTPAPTQHPTPFNYPPAPAPVEPQYPFQPGPPNYPAPTGLPPPNYPAPTAPPTPTTPKPKKNFLDKLIRGFMKIVSPQTALNSRSSVSNNGGAANFLGSFLQQLQQTYKDSQKQGNQQGTLASSTQAAVLENLVKRLQGQSSEGSQFVVNLVQSLNPNTNPTTSAAPANARSGGSTEQLLGALLKGIGSSSNKGGQSGVGGFFDTFQRELLRSQNPSAGPLGQKSASDILLDGFKQILHMNH